MGQMKDRMIDSMNVHEMQSYLDGYRASHEMGEGHDVGYIEFLEKQLENAEEKVDKYRAMLKAEKGPGYCVECFKSLDFDEIICSKCQDECDGRWDHLRIIKTKKESQE